MTREEVEKAVTAVISSVLKVPVMGNACRSEHQEWDSLKHIEVVFAIEDEFGIQFDEETIGQLVSVPDIVKRLVIYLNAA